MTTTVACLPTAGTPAESPSEQLSRFFRDHASVIRRFLYGKCEDWQLAEDLTQEVFAGLWKQVSCPAGFDEHVGSVRALLFRKARWALAHHYSLVINQRERALAPTQLPMMTDADPAPGPEVVAADRVHVAQVLAMLPPEQRRIVALCYLKGLTPTEIAELCHVHVTTVHNRLRAAKMQLREHFGVPQPPSHLDGLRQRREAAAEAYRASVAAGTPLTSRQLARKFGADLPWANAIIRESGLRASLPEKEVKSKILLQLRTRIADGTYPAGAPLPTGYDLATEFEVGRTVIRKVLHALAAEGVLRREGSLSGSTVRFYPATDAESATRPAPRGTERPRLALAVAR